MLEDLRSLPDGCELAADLCIVGAGVAGLALAQEFIGSGADVLLLESGGFGGPEGTDALNEGSVVGLPYMGLTLGRTRGFGGTSELYGGQCAPMDACDFERRPWVPHSGWPLSRQELEPYYRRANGVFGLPADAFDEARLGSLPFVALPVQQSRFVTHVSAFSPRRFLGRNLLGSLQQAPNVRVLVHATLTELRASEGSTSVEMAEVRSLTGKKARIKSGAYVLCCGAIENARVLLASCAREACGLGNRQDLVGRFLQDHVIATCASIKTRRWLDLHKQWRLARVGDLRYARKLRMSDRDQASTGTLNGTASVVYEYADEEAADTMVRLYRGLLRRRWSQLRVEDLEFLVTNPLQVAMFGARHLGYDAPCVIKPRSIGLSCITEQAPNPDSRVTLSDGRDALGLRKVRIDWRLGELERSTLRTLTRIWGAELEGTGTLKVTPHPWIEDAKDDWTMHVRDILHTAGTTRMATDRCSGVVDADCRVFDVENLYVAGTSVFPTVSHANPVLTIAALSLRLADRLKVALAAR